MLPRDRDKPFNRGNLFRNFFAVLCWPKPITYSSPSDCPDLACSYIQPRAHFEEEDHRFDKLPMVGEGTWDDPVEEEGDIAPEVDVPMTQIVRN